MRLFALTALVMLAFAGNSVLNRLAVGGGLAGPVDFAFWRVLAGAGVLAALVLWRHLRSGGPLWPAGGGRLVGAAGLLAYLLGFSLAYVALDAGAGALILFGTVQITMFAGALWAREPVPPARWLGAALAFGGLVVLLAPGSRLGPEPFAALTMAGAGVGWGLYSLSGRHQTDALGATAANFLAVAPVLGAVLLLGPRAPVALAPGGLALAVLSGAVTSGLGYALWYRILPALGAGRAAAAQMTVPLIAAAAGLALLGEPMGLRFALAAALVLGGVALATVRPAKLPE
ncbi:MAG: DMT family transporter [Paracoccaceae bacterium]